MIKDLGNCGNQQKLERIMSAVQSAQGNKCCLVIFLDPLVYGKNSFMVTSENIQEVSFAEHNSDLLVIRDNKVIASLPWWDIIKVRVIWWYE